MTTLSIYFIVAVVLYTGTAAVTDIRYRRIPNYLTVTTALLGFAYHGLAPQGAGLLTALAGFTVGFGVLLLPWLFGGGGMGDIKLLAALGTWLGPTDMLIAFAASILLAGVLALILILWASARQGVDVAKEQTIDNGQRASSDRGSPIQRKRRVLPFAVAVALSTWGFLAWNVVRQSL
jgi:prepilin peptidase CpaA